MKKEEGLTFGWVDIQFEVWGVSQGEIPPRSLD